MEPGDLAWLLAFGFGVIIIWISYLKNSTKLGLNDDSIRQPHIPSRNFSHRTEDSDDYC